ncbi:flagellar hook-basal body complex protein FlhO [Barrientosiimonas marina]|uniref:Flagellar hook-basal body protein n=1 Tax=Lentibacillus kimchii TaxID=1542911 RepID=A0ABW2UYE7_9BACI
MLRGFYTAASGMIAQQRQQEALSNNITNAQTPGYKADQPAMRAFPEMLMQQMGNKQVPTEEGLNLSEQKPIGSMHTGVYTQETIPDQSQGDLRNTGTSTDLALVNGELPDDTGGVFFTVQNAEGEERYTRNGSFTVDNDGFLATSQGYRVLDEAGNPVQTDNKDFTVDGAGNLQTDDETTPLGIAYTDDVAAMVKEGNDVFAGDTEAAPAGAGYTVKQGSLEQSNTDPAQSMTQMMEGYRLFETNQRVLKAYDQSMGKAVSEIARLR